ncbi:mobile element transfer protein [Streptomyces sp. NPDC003710]
MPARDHFHSVMSIGPVQIGTHRDRNGQTKHAAVCTADRCGWSADYLSRPVRGPGRHGEVQELP